MTPTSVGKEKAKNRDWEIPGGGLSGAREGGESRVHARVARSSRRVLMVSWVASSGEDSMRLYMYVDCCLAAPLGYIRLQGPSLPIVCSTFPFPQAYWNHETLRTHKCWVDGIRVSVYNYWHCDWPAR